MIFIIKEVTQLLVSDGNYNLNLHSNEAWPIVAEQLRSLDLMICVHLRRHHSYRLFTLRYRAHNFRERRRRLHAPRFVLLTRRTCSPQPRSRVSFPENNTSV